jgi:hypothetical protein
MPWVSGYIKNMRNPGPGSPVERNHKGVEIIDMKFVYNFSRLTRYL